MEEIVLKKPSGITSNVNSVKERLQNSSQSTVSEILDMKEELMRCLQELSRNDQILHARLEQSLQQTTQSRISEEQVRLMFLELEELKKDYREFFRQTMQLLLLDDMLRKNVEKTTEKTSTEIEVLNTLRASQTDLLRREEDLKRYLGQFNSLMSELSKKYQNSVQNMENKQADLSDRLKSLENLMKSMDKELQGRVSDLQYKYNLVSIKKSHLALAALVLAVLLLLFGLYVPRPRMTESQTFSPDRKSGTYTPE